VQSLEVHPSIPGNDQFNGNSYDRKSGVKGGLATRKLQITAYSFGDESGSTLPAVVLKVRCPEDLHRERVKFDLKGLDLF
jgi:hypothetical protein